MGRLNGPQLVSKGCVTFPLHENDTPSINRFPRAAVMGDADGARDKAVIGCCQGSRRGFNAGDEQCEWLRSIAKLVTGCEREGVHRGSDV